MFLLSIDPHIKVNNLDKVDVDLTLKMGRIRLVFLMKFINDILAFIEPFSGAKDMVVEQAGIAREEAEKRLRNAYANKTRAKLNVSTHIRVLFNHYVKLKHFLQSMAPHNLQLLFRV